MAALRATTFYLVTGKRPCWTCGETTPVSAIVFDGYEEQDEEESSWLASIDRTMLGCVLTIDSDSLVAVRKKAAWLQFTFSQTVEAEYLGNCCTSCQALQGDHFLTKPDEIFFPTDRSQMQPFAIDRFDQQIEVEAGPMLSSWLDWLDLPVRPDIR